MSIDFIVDCIEQYIFPQIRIWMTAAANGAAALTQLASGPVPYSR